MIETEHLQLVSSSLDVSLRQHLGAAHYHRFPAMRSVFKALFKNTIAKTLRREVWGYWYLASKSGVTVDPDLKELRKPWADLVCKENIMVNVSLLIYQPI
jgi:hypothetical protein